MGFDSKCEFAPPTILLGLLLCPWVWGILTAAPAPTILLGFLWPWTWGISSQPLQQSTATAPDPGCGVSQLLLNHTVAASSSVVQPLLAPEPRGCSPITSWQIDGETMETVTDFIFLGSKVTADGDCSHEIKRCLFLGRKTKTNLDSILKSRDTTLPTKVHLVKAIVFPVVMYGCEMDYIESWVPKNWCFWTMVLVNTLESPLDLKDIQPVNPKGNQS